MIRKIYEVYAKVADANGTYNTLSGYPKVFDSKTYNYDIDKTLARAKAEFYNTLGTMYARDDRQLQTVILMAADGFIIENKSIGELSELPDPAIIWTDPSLTAEYENGNVILTRGGEAVQNYGVAVVYHLYEGNENLGIFGNETMTITPSAGTHTYTLVAIAGDLYDEGAQVTIEVPEPEPEPEPEAE